MNLKKIRLERGMTQSDVAAAVGLSDEAICTYEIGTREPNLETLRKLATVLNCTIDELIGNEEGEDGESERAEDGAARGAGPVRTA